MRDSIISHRASFKLSKAESLKMIHSVASRGVKLISKLLLGVLILTMGLPWGAVVAEPTGEFYATPISAMPGAEVVFSGYGFSPDSSVELYLMTTPNQYLGMLPTSATGTFSGALSLPAVAPGVYDVMASPNDVFTSLTILPALGLAIAPNYGPPGTLVHFWVTNLVAGQLRLDYEGFPVFGPVEVDAGAYEGDFLVPGDRPLPLGNDAEVKAVNLLASQVLGTSSTFFLSQEPGSNVYNFTNVLLPPDPVEPGNLFTITGQITPPPQSPLASQAIKVLWKAASGQVVPITVGSPTLLSDGSFSAQARAPSLLGGDAVLAQAGGQVGLAFFDLNNGSYSMVGMVGWGLEPVPPVFKLKVQDNLGNPIAGALVDIRVGGAKGSLSGETTGGLVLKNQLSYLGVHENQITQYLGPLGTNESDPFTCDKTPVYGRTNAQGEFTFEFDPAFLAMMGQKIFLGNLPNPTYNEVPLEITFPLYVNALHQGFGTLQNGQPVPYEKEIRFSGVTNLFYDAKTNFLLDTNPLIVTLPALPPNTQVSVPIVPKVIGGGIYLGGIKDYLGTGYPLAAFGKFYSFPQAQFPEAWFSGSLASGVTIEFQHDQALFGALDESNIKFKLLGQTYAFINQGKKFTGTAGCDSIVYRANIPNFNRFPAGNHTGLIEVQDLSVSPNQTKYYIQLNMVPAPTWILDTKYKYRNIYIAPYGGHIVITGRQYPAGDPASTSSLDTNVNKVGQLNNRVRFQDEVREILYPDKTSGVQYSSQADTTALNEDVWPPTKFNDSVAGGKTITIPKKTTKALDTGKMPLYRHVWGIPPIASATIGADMWFDAYLTYEGSIQFLAAGGPQTNLYVTPEASVGVDAWFDLSAVFGLVSANAHAVPQITLKMPAKYINGGLDDASKCFLYKLDIKWSVKTGVCPFCYSESGTEPVFNGSNPNPCLLPAVSTNLSSTDTFIFTPAPPAASPALAVDGFGHTLMLWSDANGYLQSRLLSGGQLVSQQPVTTSGASIDPQVAFYAPNKALALWTESSLTLNQSQTADLAQRVEAQHLKYALWNGSAWDAPQSLTLPADSHGEGGVALAGCMSTHPGCPAGGAATAVWVRDAVGDLAAHQLRLYYASFQNSAWSAIQAVDPGSTGTDAEPSLAYRSDGIPLVVWVRDADRNLGSLADRQFAHRLLSAGQSVVLDGSLPSGAVEPSLALNVQNEMLLAFTVATDPQAMIGNQRQLHVAWQNCSTGCAWFYQALVDANARPVHAESPALTLKTNGQVMVTYRALGFGSGYPGGPVVMQGDALGTILGTGEMAQALIDFSKNNIAPSYLTNAGNTVWQTKAVFDSLLNQTYAVSSVGSGPVLPPQLLARLHALGYQTGNITLTGEPVALVSTSALPDLAILEVLPSTLYPEGSLDSLSVQVLVLNNGPDAYRGLELRLTWDGPHGLGSPAGETSLSGIAAGSVTMVEFSMSDSSLVLPAFPHLPHTLYAQVNPKQNLPESDYENNMMMVAIGGLPSPEDLEAVAQPGDSAVFLKWSLVGHEDVVGYRVYRSSDGRIYEPVGSSFTNGFVDLSAVLGQSYLYAVASYADDGYESTPGAPVLAQVGMLYEIFIPAVQRLSVAGW